MRVWRPTFLRDTALSILFGAIGGLAVTVVLVLTGFPEWGETLLSYLVVFASFLLVGLAIRAGMHAWYEYMNHGLVPDLDEGELSRDKLLAYSRPWMRFGAGSLGAAAVLSLAFLVGTGDAFPG